MELSTKVKPLAIQLRMNPEGNLMLLAGSMRFEKRPIRRLVGLVLPLAITDERSNK